MTYKGGKVYTIGHSTHNVEYFFELLKRHNLSCVIDVRSTPYSQYNPQFNMETLKAFLNDREIVYAHLGKEFGARHTKPELLDANGQVDFLKVWQTEEFKRGIKRLYDAVDQGYRVALMCSESNPMDCHRFSMISRQLKKEGFDVIHILPDGNLIAQDDLEQKTIEKYLDKIHTLPLFDQISPEDELEAAYKIIIKKIAYKSNKSNSDDNEDNQ